MHDDIAQRIAKSAGEADLVDTLAAKISGSELHSILLAVLKQRVGKVEKAALMQPSPVTKACDLDGRLLNKIEGLTYAAAAGYDAIELSPLNPFGAVPVLTGLDLANILSTVRAFECASPCRKILLTPLILSSSAWSPPDVILGHFLLRLAL